MGKGNDLSVDPGRCCYCGACVSVCPKDSLFLDDTILRVDLETCIMCGLCIKECPVGALGAGWFK